MLSVQLLQLQKQHQGIQYASGWTKPWLLQHATMITCLLGGLDINNDPFEKRGKQTTVSNMGQTDNVQHNCGEDAPVTMISDSLKFQSIAW